MGNVFAFGQQLLDTNDLDPVYVALWEARLLQSVLRRWLLAYWCFYHAGTASWIADQESQFWSRMETAAGSKDYPRSSERRHFRAANAIKSVAYLKSRGIDGLFDPLVKFRRAADLIQHVQRNWVGFGPWIAFKMADMVERLALAPLQFDLNSIQLFDSPREGAELVSEQVDTYDGSPVVPWAVSTLLSHYGDYPAPPRGDRPIGLQEAETILCKWKSHCGGHYHVGEDVSALRRGLLWASGCRLSQKILKVAPRAS